MPDIAAARARVAGELASIWEDRDIPVHVYATPPTRMATPAVLLTEADAEFVTPDENQFGAYLLAWKALIVCRPSPSNEQMTAEADALVSDVLTDLEHLLPEVDTYAALSLAGQQYMAVPITLTTTTATY